MSELSAALRAQRVELAGEVHDEVIPPLFAARMQLETLAARLEPSDEAAASDQGPSNRPAAVTATEIRQAVELIALAISKSRQILANLAPHDPGEPHWQAEIRRAIGGRPIELRQSGNLPWQRIEPNTAITVTSIVTEAIRNAVRHGRPSHIEIATDLLGESDSTRGEAKTSCQVRIVDDGAGFDPGRASDHHGLHLMRLRAAAIGGHLVITSRPGGPTEVTLRWPLTFKATCLSS